MTINIIFTVKTRKSAKTAQILGDFNNWGEYNSQMKKIRPGFFQKKIRFQTKRKYYYKFKVDGKWKELMEDTYPATGIYENRFGTNDYCIDLNVWDTAATEEVAPDNIQISKFDNTAEKILKKCIEEQNFVAWDSYRKGKNDINLTGIDLSDDDLTSANLSGLNLSRSKCVNTTFYKAILDDCIFINANLKEANFVQAKLHRAQFQDAILDRAELNDAELVFAQATYASLLGSNIHNTYIQGTNFSFSKVDGETLINTTQIDKMTNFTGVGLSSARLKPGLLESLSYNIRKFRWEEWYNKGNPIETALKKLFCKPFWWLSDYGQSTMRIVGVFFFVALSFSFLYWQRPEILHNTANDFLCRFYRTFYFSIVTMITLGFSNMNAAKNSFIGNTAVCVQIIFGYVTLAALVTRISVLFNSGGPEVGFKKWMNSADDVDGSKSI